jgi:hypothetical protein
MKKQPLSPLQWDLGGLFWQILWAAKGNNLDSFFNYSLRLIEVL